MGTDRPAMAEASRDTSTPQKEWFWLVGNLLKEEAIAQILHLANDMGPL